MDVEQASAGSKRSAQPRTWAWLGAMIATSAALIAAIWIVPYLPTNDGPQHVLSGYIENHYTDPGAPYAERLRLLPSFASRGFLLIFEPLEALFGYSGALRITQSMMAIGALWGFGLLVAALHRTRGQTSNEGHFEPVAGEDTRRLAALLGALIALPWGFYMGFFPNVVGNVFGLFVLAFAIRAPVWTRPRRMVVGLMLFLQAIMHVFSASVTGALIFAVNVGAAPRGSRLREALSSALMGVPAAGIAILAALDQGQLSGVALSQEASWVSWQERLLSLPGSAAPGPPERGCLILALVIAACGIALRRARRGDASRVEGMVAAASLVALALGVLAPLHVPGWQLFSPRFVSLSAALGLALVDPTAIRRKAPWAPIFAVMAIVASASLLVSIRFHRKLAAGCADLVSGLGRGKGRFLLPVILEPTCSGLPNEETTRLVPYLTPTIHIGALYAADRGAFEPYLFVGAPSAHVLGERQTDVEPPIPPARLWWAPLLEANTRDNPVIREQFLTTAAIWGGGYGDVVMYGARTADRDLFQRRGYETTWQQGALDLLRLNPCNGQLEVPGNSSDAPVFVEIGVPGSRAPMDRHALPPDPAPRLIPILGGICGPVWARVSWDRDGSRTPSPGDDFCAGAAIDGRFDLLITRGAPVLRCPEGTR